MISKNNVTIGLIFKVFVEASIRFAFGPSNTLHWQNGVRRKFWFLIKFLQISVSNSDILKLDTRYCHISRSDTVSFLHVTLSHSHSLTLLTLSEFYSVSHFCFHTPTFTLHFHSPRPYTLVLTHTISKICIGYHSKIIHPQNQVNQ